MKTLVTDIEQFKNFHSVVFYDIDTKETFDYVVHESRNEFPEYVKFLESCTKTTGFIGFNIIGYDYPLFHYILTNKKRLLQLKVEDIVAELFNKSKEIIKDEHSAIPHWKCKIKLLDLFRIHHFNNIARRTSLKALQVAMRWSKVQDLPFHYTHWVEASEIDAIQEYCRNDVMSTYQFYLESKDKIKFRKRMSKEYRISFTNYPDVKIGEELLIFENAKALNITPRELRELRTKRDFIKLKDVMLPYIKFQSKHFNMALDYFKNAVIDASNTKDALKHSVIYGGVKYDYGLGGIHGTCGNGVYKSDDKGDLILVDVSSYYPNLAIQNKFYPEHLSDTFCDVGRNMYNKRMKAREENDIEMVDAIKLALNGAMFGKSNDEFSPIYDPKFMLSITVNGQLLLTMLAEQISDAGIKIIQINTDGILVKCTKEQKEILDSLCNAWMKLTKLKLDYDYFNVIVQRDVNNYLAQETNGKIKYKGTFEIYKQWHKDHSMRIVSKAVSDYFIKNKSVRNTIESCDNIYDFCISQKVGSQFITEHHYIIDGNKQIDTLQKINRFFVTKSGGAIIKRNKETGGINRLIAGNELKLFNDFYEDTMVNHNIKYDFYVAEANKIINAVSNGQMNLF